jgi:hypothetical protein
MKQPWLAFLLAVSFSLPTLAQQATPVPSKPPFAGFGNTLLDRPTNGRATPSPFTRPPLSPPPPSPSTPAAPSAGLVLATEWTGHIAQGAGGQTRKMQDLQALLAAYGTAEKDTAPHPEVTIYEGARIGGAPGENCRITYLMPLRQAETLLLQSRGIVTVARAVAPGFPDGLFIHTYDVRAGIYNRLAIMTDSAKPEPQVVSLVFKAESANYYPLSPPFKKLERDWHTHDYMNTENRGQPGIVIDTRVNDLRKTGHYLVVNMTGGVMPPIIQPSPVIFKPARFSPKETTTWHVPEPLIKLILYTLSQQLGQQPGPLGTGTPP